MSDERKRPHYLEVHDELRESVQNNAATDAYFTLLAIISNEGSALDANVIDAAKGKLREAFEALSDPDNPDYSEFRTVYQAIRKINFLIPGPPDYPSVDEVSEKLEALFSDKEGNVLITKQVKPGVTELGASELREHAGVSVSGLTREEDIDLAIRVHQIGVVMTSPLAYGVCFLDEDPIVVGQDCNVISGRVRALALKVMGKDFIDRYNMDSYIIGTIDE